MCPKVSEKTKRPPKGIILSVKLDVIKHLDHGEHNKDIEMNNGDCFFALHRFGLGTFS